MFTRGDSASLKVSEFIDREFREEMYGKSEAQLENMFEKIMCAFRLIRNKDVFGKDYADRLGSRMLWEKSQHEEREKVLVDRFKVECGQQFTERMETIFSDIEFSKKASCGFKTVVAKREYSSMFSPELEVTLRVLTETAWSFDEQQKAVKVPAIILPLMNSF